MSNSNALGRLMEKNLLEVFGQRDSARRKIAISEVDAEDCTFFEGDERVVGRDALNTKVDGIVKELLGSYSAPQDERRSSPYSSRENSGPIHIS
jgi:hypothetical protein